MMFNTVNTIGDRLIDVINMALCSSNVLEMREFSGKFTADVIGNVAFGLECKCKFSNPNHIEKFIETIFKVLRIPILSFTNKAEESSIYHHWS